jgi:hypothetical protein
MLRCYYAGLEMPHALRRTTPKNKSKSKQADQPTKILPKKPRAVAVKRRRGLGMDAVTCIRHLLYDNVTQ